MIKPLSLTELDSLPLPILELLLTMIEPKGGGKKEEAENRKVDSQPKQTIGI